MIVLHGFEQNLKDHLRMSARVGHGHMWGGGGVTFQLIVVEGLWRK